MLDYKRAELNLFKGDFKVYDLNISSKRFTFKVPFTSGRFTPVRLLHKKSPLISVYVESPRLTLKAGNGTTSFEKVKKTLTKVFSILQPLFLDVNNGKVVYFKSKKAYEFYKIKLYSRLVSGQVYFLGRCYAKRLFKILQVKGRASFENGMFLEAGLKVKGLNAGAIVEKVHHFKLRSFINAQAQVSFEEDTLNIGIAVGKSTILLKPEHYNKELGFFVEKAGGIISLNENSFTFNLDPILISSPYIAGFLSITKSNEWRLNVGLREFTAGQLEYILASLYPGKKWVKTLKSIVKKANFSRISITSVSKKFKSLFSTKKIKIKAKVKQGEIFLKFLPLSVKKIGGRIFLFKKLINFWGKGKALNSSYITANYVVIGFRPKFWIKLESDLSIDAKDAKEFIVKSKIFKKTLKSYASKIKPKGHIKGKLQVFYESHTHPKVKLFLFSKNLALAFKNYEFVLDEASLTYNSTCLVINIKKAFEEGIVLKDFNLKIFLHSKAYSIKVGYVKVTNKFVSKLKELEKLKDIVKKYQPEVKILIIRDLKGSFNKEDLKKLVFLKKLTAEFEVKKFFLNLPLFKPTPFYIQNATGRFNQGEIVLKGEYQAGDSSFKGEITFNVLTKKLTLKLSGLVYRDLFYALFHKTKKFKWLKINFPILVNFVFLIKEKRRILGNATFSIAGGKAKTEFLKTSGLTEIRGNFSAPHSSFKFSFTHSGNDTQVFWNGTANLTEIKRIFTKDFLIQGGEVKGWIIGKIKSPLNSLEAYLKLLSGLKAKVKVRMLTKKNIFLFDFFATGKSFGIYAKRIFFRNQDFAGKFFYKNETLSVYLNATTIDLRSVVSKKKKEKNNFAKTKLKVKGEFFAKEVFLPKGYQIENASGKFVYLLGQKKLLLRLKKAEFGGISLNGMFLFTPEKRYVFIDIGPSEGNFSILAKALSSKRTLIKGKCKIVGFFYSVDGKQILKNGVGKFELVSKNGYIQRAPLLARILALLSPIDVFKGKLPNLEKGTIYYDTLEFKGYLKDGIMHISKVYLSAAGFRLYGKGKINILNKKINMVIYVSPFKTLDVILENIPVIGKIIMSKTKMLVYVPLYVKGTTDHYHIKLLNIKSLGKGILDLFAKLIGGIEEFKKVRKQVEKRKENWIKVKNELIKEFARDSL
ncbi:MAG: hypothetical protein GXO57_00985 [Thermodesulfobacteria bacterium]|nr:hypothetical protein [Thermodesulfobacteriota bacterium]